MASMLTPVAPSTHRRYKGRGLFVSPPTVAMVRGSWQLLPPADGGWAEGGEAALGREPNLASLDDAFSDERRSGALAQHYGAAVDAQLDRCVNGGFLGFRFSMNRIVQPPRYPSDNEHAANYLHMVLTRECSTL